MMKIEWSDDRVRMCVLDEERQCVECGECSMCDLNPEKTCDNCMQCVNSGADYLAIEIDDVIEGEDIGE